MKTYQVGYKKELWCADSNFNGWELSNHKQLPSEIGQSNLVQFYRRNWDSNTLHTHEYKVTRVR